MRVATRHGEFQLSYSTNVHPGETLVELKSLLKKDVGQVREMVAPGEPFGVELRLGTKAAKELQQDGAAESFGEFLAANELYVFSLNAFPIRDFHAPAVKEEVYRPDWGEPERWETTIQLCHFLAAVLPPETQGSISTSPGSFKPWGNGRALRAEFARGYASTLHALAEIRARTGRMIRLAVEPEPFCTYETIDEFIEFYESDALTHTVQALTDDFGLSEVEGRGIVRDFLALNLDACHLAVEFEEPLRCLEKLREAQIQIAKLHVSCAATVLDPAHNSAGMAQLARLNEPRYLHQTFARNQDGRVCDRTTDLPEFLTLAETPARAATWQEVRCHFHLPLFRPAGGDLGTTVEITETLLREIIRAGQGTHIVAETYTWPILAARDEAVSVSAGIAQELLWTRQRMLSA